MKPEDIIKHTISDALSVQIDQLVDDANFIDDLGADSLDIVELIMALEEGLTITIDDEEAEVLETVGDVMTFVKNKIGDDAWNSNEGE